MIDPIAQFNQIASSSVENISAKAVSASSAYSPSSHDTTTISPEAKKAFAASLKNSTMIIQSNAENPGEPAFSSWEMAGRSQEQTFTLKNGNTQTVSIKDGDISIQEFDQGRLVKSVTGSMQQNGASLDTEYYDTSGNVSQTLHTEIQEVEISGGWTSAQVTRSIEWFDDGRKTGDMQDQMVLSTKNSLLAEDGDNLFTVIDEATEALSEDMDSIIQGLTKEEHAINYFAQLKEYGDNGLVSRDVIVEHEGDYEELTNRTTQQINEVSEASVNETSHDLNLSIHVRNYDSNGELIKDALFRDSQQDVSETADGSQKQTVAISWYNEGELIRKSQGSFSIEETLNAKLASRPTILETLGMTEDEYLTAKPQTAMELLGGQLMDSSSEQDFFVDGIQHHIAGGDYNIAEGIAKNGSPEQPYSISWASEFYKDGELLVREKDTEKATESWYNSTLHDLHFETGSALSESDRPTVLRKTSHEREIFEDGEVKSQISLDFRETLDVSVDGPDTLVTNSKLDQSSGSEVISSLWVNGGGIENVDSTPNAAAAGLSQETEQTLDEVYGLFTSMKDVEKDREGHRNYARFQYRAG